MSITALSSHCILTLLLLQRHQYLHCLLVFLLPLKPLFPLSFLFLFPIAFPRDSNRCIRKNDLLHPEFSKQSNRLPVACQINVFCIKGINVPGKTLKNSNEQAQFLFSRVSRVAQNSDQLLGNTEALLVMWSLHSCRQTLGLYAFSPRADIQLSQVSAPAAPCVFP